MIWGLSEEFKEELNAEIKTLKKQGRSSRPDTTIIKRSLSSIGKNIRKGIGAFG